MEYGATDLHKVKSPIRIIGGRRITPTRRGAKSENTPQSRTTRRATLISGVGTSARRARPLLRLRGRADPGARGTERGVLLHRL